MRVRSPEDAEQAGFLGLWLAAARFDPARGTPFWAFAKPIVRNEIQVWIDQGEMWVRRNRRLGGRQMFRVDLGGDMEGYPDGSDGPDEVFEQAEAFDLLRLFLASLQPSDKDVLLKPERQGRQAGTSPTARARRQRKEALIQGAQVFYRKVAA